MEPSRQLGGATFLDLKLFLALLNFLLSGRYLPAQTIFDGLTNLQVLDFSGQALVEVANLGEFVDFLEARGVVRVDNLQLDVLCSPELVDCLVRQDTGAVIKDLHLVSEVLSCAKFCRLEACGG